MCRASWPAGRPFDLLTHSIAPAPPFPPSPPLPSPPLPPLPRAEGFCQLVPNAIAYPGYRVTCNSDGSGQGFIQYCSDVNCGQCGLSLGFSANQCVANSRELWGNAAVSIECPARGTGDIVVAETEFLAPNAAEINWFKQPGCGQNIPDNFDRTIVVAQQGLCHRVPNAPGNEGYRESGR